MQSEYLERDPMSGRFSLTDDRELLKLPESGMDVPAAAKASGAPVAVVRERVKAARGLTGRRSSSGGRSGRRRVLR